MSLPEKEKEDADDVCSCKAIHHGTVEKAKAALPDRGMIEESAALFKVFGDPTRMEITIALLSSELCVCDLAYLLGASQSAVSHQLRILKQERLVKSRKEGKVVWYSLDDEHIKEIVRFGLEHAKERG